MRLSIVTTLYRSAGSLAEFHQRISRAAAALTDSYEIILVNDGSPDESAQIALRLLDADPSVRIVDLSRNFGHHKAMMTGLFYARGDLVFLIDSDLEGGSGCWRRLTARCRARARTSCGVRRSAKASLND
jgi:putative glycosyltransferase